MDKVDLGELAERVEKLRGASRAVDAEIALASGWTVHAGDNWVGPRGEIAVPYYTGSIDAAMSLVPEGRRRMIEQQTFNSGAEGESDRSWAKVGVMPEPLTEYRGEGRAATPALALTAAALRARLSTQQDGG